MILEMLTVLALTQAPPVKWQTDFKEAQELAQRQGRPLFIDAGREA